MSRLAALICLLGCSTAAQFDLEAEAISGVALIGLTQGCDGEGFEGSLVLLNQRGGPIYVGGRIPSWPDDGHTRVHLEGVEIDGAEATVSVTAALVVQTPPEQAYTLALDRAGAACGATPEGPWGARCDLTPCGAPGDACSVARGCCGEGEICAARVDGASLEHLCAAPSEGCDCGAGEVCVDGACLLERLGPLDPEDALVARFAATAAALLDREGGRLARWVSGLQPLALSGAGVQPLSGEALTHFAQLEPALAHDLLGPYGAPRLLEGLAAYNPQGPVVAWALLPGPAADLSERPPHIFAVLDHPALRPEDDRAFATAACQTDGAYLRYPADADLEAMAGIWVPAAARARYRLRLEIDPPPAPGARIRGVIRVDVAGLAAGAVAHPTLEAPFDVILGGAP